MRTRHALLLFVGLALLAPPAVEARSNGVSGYSGNPATNGGASCEACHSAAATTLAVSLSGPVSVLPGSTNDYLLTLFAPPPGSAGGLDVSATAGELTTFDAATLLRDGEVTHRLAMPADGVSALSFGFRWTAPDVPGAVTLYGAGLARDFMMGMVDTMGTTTLAIQVEDPSAPEDPDPSEPPPLPPVLEPPVAVAGGPYAGWVGELVEFDGSGSYDPDGTIALYEWDFGDGETGTGERPTHSYASPGSYSVSLTVVDETGLSHTAPTVAEIEEEVREEQVPDTVPVGLRVVAPRRLFIREGHLRHVNLPVIVDFRELPPGTEASGVVVLLKNGEPVADKPISIRLPASGRHRARGLGLGHGGAIRLVRLLSTVSTSDAPSVEWSASIRILGAAAESESAVTEVRSFAPQPRRVRAVWRLPRR